MNVGMGTEATQFLFWEHINLISVQCNMYTYLHLPFLAM
jgi:hypothetical protein